jgi:hypothetical protein
MVVDGCSSECPVNSTTAEVSLPCGFWVTSALELEVDTGALSQVGDGVDEGECFEIHDEFDSVSAFIAPETMVKVTLRMHGKRRGFLEMVRVRAEPDEAGSLASESGELRGDLDDVRRLADLFYAAL